MSQIFNVVIGTAGHIDHGKSSVVISLTGKDPDRLKEEKERGLTIDLGFAPLLLPSGQKVGIIDVPGHERFIKNMVAGATGIDFVLLVVAADDGVMPQTREHLEIIEILGIRQGIVALTKIDIVEPDLLELAIEDIHEFLQGTFLAQAPIYPLSNVTGEGLQALRQGLFEALAQLKPKSSRGLFRMPIQRVFSRHGYGTVVTGVPLSGQVAVGDTLELLPQGTRGRVRRIQAYLEDTQTARAGHSTALNISDLDYKSIQRGNVVATPGYFQPTRFLEARLQHLASAKQPLTNNMYIRLHTGTTEVLGRVVLLSAKSLAPGEEGYVQFILDEPVIAEVGDRYVVRRTSPMVTIGGGVIIGSADRKLKRFRPWILQRLQEQENTLGQEHQRVAWLIKQQGRRLVKQAALQRASKLLPERLAEILRDLQAQQQIIAVQGNYIHQEFYQQARQALLTKLQEYFRQHPYRLWHDKIALRQELQMESLLYETLLNVCEHEQQLVRDGTRVGLAGRQVALQPPDQELAQSITRAFAQANFAPPAKEQVRAASGANATRFEAVFEHLVDQGILVAVDKGMYFHQDAIAQARNIILEQIQTHGELVAANFRDQIKSTRKYVIPLLEYFDSLGLTVRDGNRRILRKNQPLS